MAGDPKAELLPSDLREVAFSKVWGGGEGGSDSLPCPVRLDLTGPTRPLITITFTLPTDTLMGQSTAASLGHGRSTPLASGLAVAHVGSHPFTLPARPGRTPRRYAQA